MSALRSRAAWGWSAMALCTFACTSPSSLSVQVTSDLGVPSEIDSVVIDVTREGARVDHIVTHIDPSRSLGRPVRVAFEPSLSPGAYAVHVALMRRESVVVERDARAQVSGASSLTLLMLRNCRGVVCPGAADNPTDIACLGGRCVDPSCDEEHPELCTHRACTANGDCPAGAFLCVAPTCSASGTCFPRPDDSRCVSGQVCDDLAGCVMASTLDGGALDDAGADVGNDTNTDAFVPPPLTPTVLRPWNGMATGSYTRATSCVPTEDPLRPTIAWSAVAGAGSYRVLVDDTCALGAFASCAFPSPEAMTVTSATSFVPPAPLVTGTARRFYVSITACRGAMGEPPCSAPAIRYVDVGHTRGDLDGDGTAEIVSASVNHAVLIVNQRLASSTPWAGAIVGAGAPSLAMLGDVDGDGHEDFGATWPSGVVRLARAGGTDTVPTTGTVLAGVGDLDGDGYADLAIADPSGAGSVRIGYGSATGIDPTGPLLASQLGATSFGMAVAGADLDGDGASDLVVAGDMGGQVVIEVLRSSGSMRAFTSMATHMTGASSSSLAQLAGAGDLDGDGLPDVALTIPSTSVGGWVGVWTAGSHYGVGPGPTGYDPGTSYGSALATGMFENVGWAAVAGAPFRLADAGGAALFDIDPATHVPRILQHYDPTLANGLVGYTVTVGDIDGDGFADAVLGQPTSSSVHVIWGTHPPCATRAASDVLIGTTAGDGFGYGLAH